MLPSSVFASGSVTLTWNPSVSANVVGYNIYYGPACGVYTNMISVTGLSSTNATVTGLIQGATYYFGATAVDSLGNQSPLSNEATYTVPVDSVVISNQPPTLNALTNVTINENAGLQTVNLSGITTGASNQVQTLAVTAVSGNLGLIASPAVTYTSPNSTGTLNFTPVANGNGSANITVTVNNNGASNNIVTQGFTVTVNPVNQPPTLNALTNMTINENAGLQTVNLSGITTGASNQVQTLAVTAVSSNPGSIASPVVTYTSPNSTGTLTFAPATNGYGTNVITVTVNNNGRSNNIVTRSFTVTVSPLSQSPTLNSLSNLVVVQSSGGGSSKQVVNLTGISSGLTDTTQKATVSATSSNTKLIPTPSISYTSPNSSGTLSFTPAYGVTGSSVISVTVNNGQKSNNIIARSFTVTVVPSGSTAPKITSQPTNLVAIAGQAVTFSVAATGTAPLAYQWQCNSNILPSATNAVLQLTGITAKQAGQYRVVVSNVLGATNTTAALTVYSSTAPALETTTPPSRGQFALTVNGVPGYKYVVQASTNMASWASILTNTAPFTFVDTNASQFKQRFYRSFYLP